MKQYVIKSIKDVDIRLLMFPVFLLGLTFFTGSYLILRRILYRFLAKKLEAGVICDIAEKCISSLQAILATSAGIAIATNCKDIMNDSYWVTDMYAMFALPYFYYDTWAGYQTYIHNSPHLKDKDLTHKVKNYIRNRKIMLSHHILLPTVLYPIVMFFRRGLGDFFIGAFFIFEFTVPFIALRHILARLQLKTSPFYLLSGILMTVTFTFARVLIFPYLYWRYALYKSIPIWQVPFAIPMKCNLGCLFLFVFQVYWWTLMVRGVTKVIFRIIRFNKRKET
ncbi:TLC domain-containing protein 3A-like [Lineus longissimus]|uniref:TLC domain-containing protein 3A-like n=1 Tax=Lineus longissimus TaxID=88925 RepID=UPI002B4D44CB